MLGFDPRQPAGHLNVGNVRASRHVRLSPTPLASGFVWTAATTSLSGPTYVERTSAVRQSEVVDNVPALAVGFNLALDLTRHLALVPEVRAHALSLNSGGPSAFVLRPGLAVRWTF
jgi:hypothetical protein